jgi:lactate dehydrogenase-like 2-hydroxyacid dehydrogenase
MAGQGIEKLCKALGMRVLILGRKGTTAAQQSSSGKADGSPAPRVPFEEGIRKSTVVFISCTFDENTRNMIDTPELAVMRPEMVIINVSRGGVMRTSAVVQALREKRISGAAVDVFDQEPASTAQDSAFLADDTRDLNLTFSPHVGYFSTKTISTIKSMVKQNIQNYVSGDWPDLEA